MFRMHGHFLATVFGYSIPALPLTEQLARLIQEWLQRWLDFLRWHHRNRKSGATLFQRASSEQQSNTNKQLPSCSSLITDPGVEQVRATSARTSPACRLLCPAGDMRKRSWTTAHWQLKICKTELSVHRCVSVTDTKLIYYLVCLRRRLKPCLVPKFKILKKNSGTCMEI